MTAINRRVEVDDAASTVTIPHWGITLRTLFGACIDAWTDGKPGESREYQVQYQDKTIGAIRVRQHNQSQF